MSVPVSSADVSSPRAGDAHLGRASDDREIVASIPIKVPFPILPHSIAKHASDSEAPTLVPPTPDAKLLAAFVRHRDPEAFTQIVQRYSQMVYRVAMRTVADRHLADDVFQATFLVLSQSARKIKSGEVLAAWLHGTARNLARRALTHKHTQRQHLAQVAILSRAEKGGEMTTSTEIDPLDELVRRHEQQLLDEELQQLPEASRAPLVLYYLEEKSQAEIAQLMGLSVEAVEGRLRRAKQELRLRLIRRGVTLSTVITAATLLVPSIAFAAPSSTLVSATLISALGGTAASTLLTTGATTAAKLAAQEVAAMSVAGKASAFILATTVSTTLAVVLGFGSFVNSMAGGAAPVEQVAGESRDGLRPSKLPHSGIGADEISTIAGEGFEVESQPVLFAQVETRGPDSAPKEPDTTELANTRTKKYDVTDLDAELRKKFVQFYKLSKTATFHDNIMEITASPEDHDLYQQALENHRTKRDQGKLHESDFDEALSTLQVVYANAPDAALQILRAAEQELADSEITHGRFDRRTRDLMKRVKLWRAVFIAVRSPAKLDPLKNEQSPLESNPDLKPVVYQIASLNIDHQWIALEYARSLNGRITNHDNSQSFIVRASEPIQRQISEFLANLRSADYEKNIESVSTLLSQKLKTHSDNHPEIERLRDLLKQLARVNLETAESITRELNDDVFARFNKLAFYKDPNPEDDVGTADAPALSDDATRIARMRESFAPIVIETVETTVRMTVGEHRELEFPSHIAKVDGFKPDYLSVTPKSPSAILLDAKAIGDTAMLVTCKKGEPYRIFVLIDEKSAPGEKNSTEPSQTPQSQLPVLVKEYEEKLQGSEGEILKWQQSYRAEQVEKEQVRDELARQSKEHNDRIRRLNKVVDHQRKQLEDLQNLSFEVPDGKVTNVDASNGTVWLNIGRTDGLRAQVTFSVYAKSSTDLARLFKDVKAIIEVVEVNETSSVARIVEADPGHPIEIDDLIFSPAWTEGVREYFALVGDGDLNSDGERDAKDRKILKDLLVNANAEIDIEITHEGLRVPVEGQLTTQTKWLIIGEVGDLTTAVNDPAKLKQILAVQKQHEMLVQEAVERGIRVVSLKDFLTYLGWKPVSRVLIPPGANAPFQPKAGAVGAVANAEQIAIEMAFIEVDVQHIGQLADKSDTGLTPKPDFRKVLNSMTKEGTARCLTEPSLVTPLGIASHFLSGGEFPIPSVPSSTGTEDVRQRVQEYGTKVDLTPHKREADGRLLLEYSFEISSINANHAEDVEGNLIPNVAGMVSRGFTRLSTDGKAGVLLGPITTSAKTNNDEPTRNVSTYLWIRAQTIVQASEGPQAVKGVQAEPVAALPPVSPQSQELLDNEVVDPSPRIQRQSDQKLAEVLARTVDIEVDQIPFGQFMNQLADELKLTSVVDGAGFDRNVLISISSNGCTLRQLLDALAPEIHPDARFIVRDNVLYLRCVKRSATSYEALTYDLSLTTKTSQEVEDFIATFINPHQDHRFQISRIDHILVVKTTPYGHLQIEDFLHQAAEGTTGPSSPKPVILVTRKLAHPDEVPSK